MHSADHMLMLNAHAATRFWWDAKPLPTLSFSAEAADRILQKRGLIYHWRSLPV